MTSFTRAIVVITVMAAASSASAQQIQSPPRASGQPREERPIDTERNRQELIGEMSFLGGYDDNLSAATTAGPFAPRASGYAGAGNGLLRYFIGRPRKFLNVSGRGLLNTYETVGPSYGAGLTAAGQTPVSRRTTLGFSQSVQSLPFYALNAFGSLRDELGVESPDTNPSNGVTEARSLVLDSSATVTQEWTRDFTTDGSYTFGRTRYNRGVAFDSRTHAGTLGMERGLGRSNALTSSYRFVDSLYTEASGREFPNRNHMIDVGFERERDLSRTRRVSMVVRAGAEHVDTLDPASRNPLEYWSPSAFGSLQYDWARTWSVAADYRRATSVLNGLVPDTFRSHAASLRTGGYLSERIEGSLVVGYANGQGGAESDDQYDGYTGTAQLRVRLAGGWSTVVNYNHYQYRLTEDASLFLGVPTEVHRNSLWLGFSWAAPIFRQYMRTASR